MRRGLVLIVTTLYMALSDFSFSIRYYSSRHHKEAMMAIQRLCLLVVVALAVACDVSTPTFPDVTQPVDVTTEGSDLLHEFVVDNIVEPDITTDDLVASDPLLEEGEQDVTTDEVTLEIVLPDITIEVTPAICSKNEECGIDGYCNLKECAAPGVCSAVPTSCPKLYKPVCGCDNKNYDNECFAASFGVSVAHYGLCTDSKCAENGVCSKTDFCALNNCNFPGVCKPKPTTCQDVWAPVCGCDGVTYSNECEAAAASMSVAYTGECKTGCKSSAQCGSNEYCELTNCEPPGVCKSKPQFCLLIEDPVCGCDGKTYKNECTANQAGASVAYKGECLASACISNENCAATDFCQMKNCAPPGECIAKPTMCPLVYNPVCGCDDKTYNNSCVANSNGINVKSNGPCL